MPLVCGVDSSTQSTKVELRDADTGRLLARGRADHPPTTPPRSEQDPQAWWSALVDAVHGALAELATGPGAAAAGDVVALAVAGQQHGLVVTDETGRPLRPAKLWNDTESAAEATRLVARLGADTWAHSTGSVPVASFTITKLAWLATHEPQHADRLAHVLLPHDWLNLRATGELVTDRGDASGTGYWSPGDGTWRTDLLDLTGIDRSPAEWEATLPRVHGPTEPAGPLTPAAAEALGLPAGLIVGPGTGDNMAAALGVGLHAGDIAVSIGTSGTVFSVSDAPTADATGAVAGFADATGRYLPLVCTLNAALVTDTVARLLGVDHQGFDQLALSAPAGAGGLVLVPYLAGERTPNRPDATGTLHGLRTDASRGQLARAAVEGVVCGLLDGVDALGAVGVPIGHGRTVLVGGGARSMAYRQVLADLSGRPVTVPDDDELVALGACVQAAATWSASAPEVVADAWRVGGGPSVPPGDIDRGAIRAAYAVARG